jgi:uncharacterized protein
MQRFCGFLLKTFDLAQKRKSFVITFWVLAIIFFAFSMRQIRTELRVYDITDKNFPSTETLRKMKNAFGSENSVSLIFTPTGPEKNFSVEEACSIRNWLQKQTLNNPEIARAMSPFDLRYAKTDPGHLWYPRLITLDCTNPSPSTSIDLSPIHSSPWAGIVSDKNESDLAIEVSFRDTDHKTSFGKFDPAPIGLILKDLNENFLKTHPRVRVQLGGRAAFQWHYKEMVKKDAFINLLLLVLILFFFKIFYGTWKSGAYLVGTIVIAAIITYGAMALAGHPIDILSNGLFFMICVSSFEDFLFLSQEHLLKPKEPLNNFRNLLAPSFFTSLTTMIGFGSLYLSDIQVIQRFGLWAAFAAFVEWITMFYFLPTLHLMFQKQGSWSVLEKAWRPKFVESISQISFGKPFFRASLVLFVFSFLGFFHLNLEDSPRKNFPKSHPNTLAMKYLKESRGWEGSILVLFQRDDEKLNQGILDKISLNKNVALVDSPYTTTNYFTKGTEESVGRLIKQELNFAEILKGYFATTGEVRAVIYLKSFDLSQINSTVQNIKEICPPGVCEPAGEGVVYAEYSDKVSNTLFNSFILSLVLVGLILIGLSWKYPLKVKLGILVSSFWGPVLMIGVLGVFQIPLNLVTSIFASILVGLTGDNAIQYLFASQGQNLLVGIKKRGLASIHLAILMCLSSLMFTGLTLVPMKLLGGLLFLGFVFCLLGDLNLLQTFILRQDSEEEPKELRPTLSSQPSMLQRDL